MVIVSAVEGRKKGGGRGHKAKVITKLLDTIGVIAMWCGVIVTVTSYVYHFTPYPHEGENPCHGKPHARGHYGKK